MKRPVAQPMSYYKATRPDGTDFATGTTRPVEGEWMPRINGRLKLCKHGYHVSDALGETLIGGSWPCRLFEVEIAESETPPSYIDVHKRVTHSYRPIREVPAWQALGPNGQEVAALIERCKVLTAQEINDLAAAREAARNAAWEAARDAAWEAARDAAWVAAGYAAGYAAGVAAGYAAWVSARDSAWVAARAAARAAAGNAAGALVVRDLITPEQFDALYGPWAQVIEGKP